MKKSKKIGIILSGLLFLFLLTAFSSKAFAFIPIGTGEDNCTNPEDCAILYPGQGNLTCQNGYCGTVSYTSILDTLKEEAESPTQNLFQYINGNPDPAKDTRGVFDSLTGAAVLKLVGTPQKTTTDKGGPAIGGAIGFSSNLVASLLTTKPISGVEYLADIGRNFGLVKPAYAQGVGFAGFSKILPIWQAARNLTYFFFIIIFILIGLAVMFRVKLDPKTVITIQNSLPKLVVALILVTFSYAIAGLMIDLIYLLIYIGILALSSVPGVDTAALRSQFLGLNFGDALGLVFGGMSTAVGKVVGGLLASSLVTGLISLAISGPFVGGLVAGGTLLLPLLIFAIVALILIVKLFFTLLVCYGQIIIGIITAPLQIVLGVLPGSKGGFSSWFNNLLSNILVFPAVALFLLLGHLLTTSGGPSWTPPVLGAQGDLLVVFIGFAMLFLVNQIPQMIKDMFGIKPTKYGTAIGAAIMPVVNPIYKAGASTLISKFDQEHPAVGAALSAITGVRGAQKQPPRERETAPGTGHPAV